MSKNCKICQGTIISIDLNGRPFLHCQNCYVSYFAGERPLSKSLGMGMDGSWTGPGGGGFREYFLANLLRFSLEKESFLLYGTGNTTTLENLLSEGFDVVGSDISIDVIEYKKKQFGSDRFYGCLTHHASLKRGCSESVSIGDISMPLVLQRIFY